MGSLLEKIAFIAGQMNPGNEGKVHKELRERMEQFANDKGFTLQVEDFPNDQYPDIFRSNDNGVWIFIGEAKDSKNELPTHSAVVDQLKEYIEGFKYHLGREYRGGILAVATDDEIAAKEWKLVMDALTKDAGLVDKDGKEPNFTIKKLDEEESYIIWW